MPYEDIKILEFNQDQKCDKTPLIIYKVSGHIPSDFSMSTISSFRSNKNNDVYRGKYCMKKFDKSLREHAMKIIILRRRK